ncbi:MAG TPA: PAS domain S-box protein [Verrucomicrobiae bacterium]|nr:PAS domain S-box protein [Verrucomicrobiae bacterium]
MTETWPLDGGELGALIRSFDWAATSLGPRNRWPQPLKTVTDMLLRSAVPMVLLWGPDGVMIYNDAYAGFAGGRHPRLLGSKVLEGWPEVADFNRHVMAEGLAGRSLSFTDQELVLYRKGVPEKVALSLDYSPILGEDGLPAGVLAIVIETTERVRADGMAYEAEQHFRLLVHGVTDYAIYMLDPTGVVTSWNPGAERIKGYRREEILGHHYSRFHTEEDRAAGVPDRALAIAAAVGKYEYEGWRLRKNGERFWASVVIDAIRAVDGTLVGFAKVTRDRTEHRQAQQALEEAREALFQSQKMEAVGQLTGGVAHDFNNMLAGIIGAMELLRRRIRSGRYAETDKYIDAAVASANRAAALTQRLLAFGRRQSLDVKPVNINAVVTSMVDLLARTMGEDIGLETRLRPDLWLAMTDANQVENALLNLAINARDAMPGGGKLTITTEGVSLNRADAAGADYPGVGDYVVLTVSDTGQGMAPEILARAFEPFYTTKPIGQGTGLGLSMIYGFAKQVGGHVRITSEVDRGTNVLLYMPRVRGAQAERREAAETGETPAGAGETLLVVEDDASVRMQVMDLLTELGYAAIEAHDGGSALLVLRSQRRIDLLVTDVGLPGGMNGRQLAEMARQLRPGLKTLFITGYAEGAASRARFLDPGMDLIAKPFTLDALAAKIRRVIESDPPAKTG